MTAGRSLLWPRLGEDLCGLQDLDGGSAGTDLPALRRLRGEVEVLCGDADVTLQAVAVASGLWAPRLEQRCLGDCAAQADRLSWWQRGLEAAERSLAPALRQLDELREKCAALEAALDRRAQKVEGRERVLVARRAVVEDMYRSLEAGLVQMAGVAGSREELLRRVACAEEGAAALEERLEKVTGERDRALVRLGEVEAVRGGEQRVAEEVEHWLRSCPVGRQGGAVGAGGYVWTPPRAVAGVGLTPDSQGARVESQGGPAHSQA